MKNFNHTDAESLSQAAGILKEEQQNARIIAGGTDLLSVLKHKLEPDYPETIVNIKSIEGLDHIVEDEDGLKIGATAKLCDIASSPLIQQEYGALADAARSVATPLIRNLATIGGNLCQEVRCWYYRYPDEIGGRIQCLRKGGDTCSAMTGENKNHSIFGARKVNLSGCSSNCPAHVDIPEYLAKLRAGDMDGAASILLEANPIPAVTSRVCTHFCQMNCKRKEYDDNVNIGGMERYVGDYILEHSDRFMVPPKTDSGKRVAIVGSGPAGLTAAFYLRSRGHSVRVYDKMEEAGGLLRYAIPEYRLPKEIVRNLISALEHMGIEFLTGVEIGKDIPVNDLVEQYDSVFLNTGAWKRPLIGLDGEELTTFGLDFLIEVNKWMGSKIGKDIIVVGGGNVAVDVAITAKRLGAANVVMACLEPENQMPASEEELNRAREEGITILPSWGPKEILRDNGEIVGLVLKRCTAVFNELGHFAPSYDENETTTLHGSSILMAVGQKTDLSFLGEALELEVSRGLISVDPATMKTSVDKVFAVGDVTTGPKTVVDAIADGKKASVAVHCFMTGEAEGDTRHPLGGLITFDASCTGHSKAARLPERPKEERGLHLEDSYGLTWEQVQEEAKRCFNCGCLAVNPSDVATVLTAMDAEIVTSKRREPIGEMMKKSHCRLVEEDEIVTEIRIPASARDYRIGYDKFRVRDSHDFAVVSVASAYKVQDGVVTDARIVLGAVAPIPLRAKEAEAYITGKAVTGELAAEAAEIALQGALPLSKNGYKVQIAKTLVRNSLLNARTPVRSEDKGADARGTKRQKQA